MPAQLCFFLEAPGENLFSCLLQLLETAHIPWLVAPSIFRASRVFSHHVILTWRLPHIRALVITVGLDDLENPR